MKVKLRLAISCFIITISLFLLYLSQFSLGMDLMDYGWAYSYYHFQTMWKHGFLILLITLGLILMVSTRDYYKGTQRKIFTTALFTISLVQLIELSNMFFSLNLLMQNGYSMYQSLSQSPYVFMITPLLMVIYLIAIVLLMFNIGKQS